MTEWLFPSRCPVCFGLVMPKGAMLHEACERKLQVLTEPLCMRCGKPLQKAEEEYCPSCMIGQGDWDMGRSVYLYRGAAGKAIRKIKEEGTEEFVRFFGKQMVKSQRRFLSEIRAECIVPVPLHKSKRLKRGFNQAELLAGTLAKELGIPVRNLLIKNKKTKDQKQLTLEQRKKNLENVYRVQKGQCPDGMPETVLLLDDIITTGSTLSACATVLKAAGVKRVYFLTVCSGE